MKHIIDNLSNFPISFKYGDIIYSGICQDFKLVERKQQALSEKNITNICLIHCDGLLQMEIKFVEYLEHDACEYTIYFKNVGNQNTKSITDVCSLDIKLGGQNPLLKGIGGDAGKLYAPYEVDLSKENAVFVSDFGRPTHHFFPYYNFAYGDKGLMFAIGWPGCWESSFISQGDNETVHIKAGLHKFNSYLKPGEVIRSPLMAFVEYNGRDERVAVNAWRRWYLRHNHPQKDGKPFNTILTAGSNRMTELMVKATEENQIQILNSFHDHDISLDYWWMDAGWYTNSEGGTINSWWFTGTLTVDKKKFPTEMAAITEAAEKADCETLVWFEPEWFRVNLEKFLANTPDFDPSWLIMHDSAWVQTGNPWYLVNIGIPECRQWIFKRICKVITRSGISVYRQDFNADPGSSWRYQDEQGRAGMTENLYVQGYLRLWDDILKTFPGIVIDSCASGGGRNDLETMRRSVPLTRTDFNYCDYTIRQSMIQSLSKWLPYNGNIGPTMEYAYLVDEYGIRSSYCACLMMTYNVYAENFNWDLLTAKAKEFRQIKDYILSDYYELVPWSNRNDSWRGWEYFDEKKQEGVIQLFRPENSITEKQNILIYGVDKDRTYVLSDFDGNNSSVVCGEILLKGFDFILPEPRSCAVITIKCQ